MNSPSLYKTFLRFSSSGSLFRGRTWVLGGISVLAAFAFVGGIKGQTNDQNTSVSNETGTNNVVTTVTTNDTKVVVKPRIKPPSDSQIFALHYFEEPLVPIAGPWVKNDNSDLVSMLDLYGKRSDPEDLSIVTDFIRT